MTKNKKKMSKVAAISAVCKLSRNLESFGEQRSKVEEEGGGRDGGDAGCGGGGESQRSISVG